MTQELTITVKLEGNDNLKDYIIDNELYKNYLKNKVEKQIKNDLNNIFRTEDWTGDLVDKDLAKVFDEGIKRNISLEEIDNLIDLTFHKTIIDNLEKAVKNRLRVKVLEENFGRQIDKEIEKKIKPILKEVIDNNASPEQITSTIEKMVKRKVNEIFQSMV